MLPSLVHDWMYYNHQNDREETDDFFYRLLTDNGVNNRRANAMWFAVRTAGELFWENDDEDEEKLVKLCKKVRNRQNFDRYMFPKTILDKCET